MFCGWFDNILTSLNLRRYGSSLNYLQTLLFNFRAFPIDIAIKFPVYVRGTINIIRVGKIVLPINISRGMIVIGNDYYKSVYKSSFINWGTIEFDGKCVISSGTRINNRGKILLENGVVISENCYISISESLRIGNNTSVGYNCSITDSDDHYMVDVRNGQIFKNCKGIIIGKHNWIGSSSFLKKGAVLPDYTIVASANSLVAKDYSNMLEPYSIIGGIPARLIKKGYRRIMNTDNESLLRSYFENNKGREIFTLSDIQNLEQFCRRY